MMVLVIEGPRMAAMMMASNRLGYDIKISLTSITPLPHTLGQKAAERPRLTPINIESPVAHKPIKSE